MYDEKEEDRLEHVQIMKAKGKGAPKKKKTKIGEYIHLKACVWLVRGIELMVCVCRDEEEGWEAEVEHMVSCTVYSIVRTRVRSMAIALARMKHFWVFWGIEDTIVSCWTQIHV